MANSSKYFDFIASQGLSIAEINPGSKEMALRVDNALEAIELLKDSQMPILGGDIITSNAGRLIYAYQLWGSEYHYLDWYCEKSNNETNISYCIRSYEVAKEAISKAHEISKFMKSDCLIIFVI